MKICKLEELKKKSAFLMLVFVIAGSLVAGCSSHSHSYDKSTTTNAAGQQTVVVEKEQTSATAESHGHTGILGGTFHLVGEILAFPFEVIAGAFRFIF